MNTNAVLRAFEILTISKFFFKQKIAFIHKIMPFKASFFFYVVLCLRSLYFEHLLQMTCRNDFSCSRGQIEEKKIDGRL